MGYRIRKERKSKRGPATFWSGEVTIWSGTRINLYEEIDRFVEENQPQRLEHMSGELVPSFLRPSGKKVSRWEVRLRFGDMKD